MLVGCIVWYLCRTMVSSADRFHRARFIDLIYYRYNYSMGGYRDPWPTRYVVSARRCFFVSVLICFSALVFWVMLTNTFQTASSTYMLWVFTVPNFGNPMIFIHVPWPYPTTPIFSKFFFCSLKRSFANIIFSCMHSYLFILFAY
jgi:hypothetical protein